MKKIIDNLKYIKIYDIFSIFIFIFALIPSFIFRLINKIKRRKLLLITEDGHTARDNGYHFYKYVRKNHKDDYCYYVIDKKSNDYNKVKEFGNIIQYRSLKHWIYYLSANYNISNHKNGNPAAPLFYVLHVILGLYKNRVFLQHGILLNDCKWLYYKNTKFKIFICGAKDEYEDVIKNYGYPKKNVFYTGLARFDNLHNIKSKKNKILIMPTWRNWLGRDFNKFNKKLDFSSTLYYKKWNSILNNKKLIKYIEKNNIIIEFYPHINMQKFIKSFIINSPNIKVLTSNYDIQEALINNSLMITDYSSVSVDFAYMRKPIIYYQFDINDYRKYQYQEGYFNYINNGFGEVYEKEDKVINKIIDYHKSNYKIEKKYLTRMENFYKLYDKDNCKRIYNSIIKDNR